MDTLGIEPGTLRMRSGCDTTTPCAQRDFVNLMVPCRVHQRTRETCLGLHHKREKTLRLTFCDKHRLRPRLREMYTAARSPGVATESCETARQNCEAELRGGTARRNCEAERHGPWASGHFPGLRANVGNVNQRLSPANMLHAASWRNGQHSRSGLEPPRRDEIVPRQ